MLQNLFKGKNLYFSAPKPDDAAIMAPWYEDSDFGRYFDTDIARLMTPAQLDADKPPADTAVEFRLRRRENDALIGLCGLHSMECNNRTAKLFIGIGEAAYRGKGYAREAMGLLLQYAFCELNLHRVGLEYIAYNTPAAKLYAAFGFEQEGRVRQAVHRDGRYWDLVIMGLLASEWRTMQEVPPIAPSQKS